jgi:hypothetical protein
LETHRQAKFTQYLETGRNQDKLRVNGTLKPRGIKHTRLQNQAILFSKKLWKKKTACLKHAKCLRSTHEKRAEGRIKARPDIRHVPLRSRNSQVKRMKKRRIQLGDLKINVAKLRE